MQENASYETFKPPPKYIRLWEKRHLTFIGQQLNFWPSTQSKYSKNSRFLGDQASSLNFLKSEKVSAVRLDFKYEQIYGCYFLKVHMFFYTETKQTSPFSR